MDALGEGVEIFRHVAGAIAVQALAVIGLIAKRGPEGVYPPQVAWDVGKAVDMAAVCVDDESGWAAFDVPNGGVVRAEDKDVGACRVTRRLWRALLSMLAR